MSAPEVKDAKFMPMSRLSFTTAAYICSTVWHRSQHLIILLADWMSALTLQAVFYGKSQFRVQEKVLASVL